MREETKDIRPYVRDHERFMWLLIESFSLDRRIRFLPRIPAPGTLVHRSLLITNSPFIISFFFLFEKKKQKMK